MELLSNKIRNYQYAPGIATYGIDGAEGQKGANGNSIFYTDYNFTTNHDDLIEIVEKIRNNKLLLKNKNDNLSRNYIEGDYILTSQAELYKIIDYDEYNNNYSLTKSTKESLDYSLFFQYIGEINFKNSDTSNFEWTDNGRIYLKDFSQIVVTNNDSFLNDSSLTGNSIFNIIYNNASSTTTDFLSLITQYEDSGNHELKFYFDTNDKSFHIESEDPIILNSKVISINSDNSIEETFDNYSPISVSEKSSDTITGFYNLCKNLNYNIENSILYINYPEDSYISSIFPSNYYCIVYSINENDNILTKYIFKVDHDINSTQDSINISNIISSENSIINISILKNIEVIISKK